MSNNLDKLLIKMKKFRWCHNRMYKYYSNRNKIFTLPPIIFASTSSFLILDEEDDQNVIKYVSSTLAMLSAMFSGISMHLGYHGKADCHLMSANSYDELITKLYFMKNLKPEPSSERFKIFIEQTEEFILKIKGVNKYQIAQWVYEEYYLHKLEKDKLKKQLKENNKEEDREKEETKIDMDGITEL
tara:strand:- start:1722 stop:2279 length:558 start_codon:yes stop_codon:yes gene_type:complete